MIEIVTANLERQQHSEALIQLLDAYARDPMGGGEPLSDRVRLHLPTALAARPGTVVLLAWQGQTPVGLLIGLEGFSTFACQSLLNVHDLYVSANQRGRGIAQRLLDRAEQVAIERGYCKLTLEVLEGNSVAQAAYRRSGFRPYQLSPETGRALFWEKRLGACSGDHE